MLPFPGTPSDDWSAAQSALRRWYAGPVGAAVHAAVAARIERLLRDRYALHCLQLGGTQRGVDLLAGRGLVHRIHITGDGDEGLRAEPTALPLETNSVDLVVVCHGLEFVADPRALLREVDRVLALDGHVLAVGFNPWSPLGLYRWLGGRRVPWRGRFYSASRVADWFELLGWRIRLRESLWSLPPAGSGSGLTRVRTRIDGLPPWLPSQGGVYLLLGCKHSVPLTPLPAYRLRAKSPPIHGVTPPSRFTEGASE